MILFVFPINDAHISPENFGCGTVIKVDVDYALLENRFGIKLLAINLYNVQIGERWTIKNEYGRYYLNERCK